MTTTSGASFKPLRPGDLILVDFDPTKGTEQAGQRPAIVVSAEALQAAGRRAIVCPISRNINPWPTKVELPAGLPVVGAVLADQVRTIDHEVRVLRRLGVAPPEVIAKVRAILAALLELEPKRPTP
jgi:mRNA interferase MazF